MVSLKRLSISYRLMLFMPVLLLSLAVTIWFGLEDRKELLKQLVQIAIVVMRGLAVAATSPHRPISSP
jgi:hypothetical protein